MSPNTAHTSLVEWIARDAISCSLDSTASLNDAVDRLATSLGDTVELLGLGEPTHLVEAFLRFRNRVFQRLVEANGFRAIALESSFPRGREVNEYVLGKQTAIEEVLESGTSHGFGRMAGNRELVEWMRAYNADAGQAAKVHFYGFDSPTEMMYADSPRRMLEFVLDYLESIDPDGARLHRERVMGLMAPDADWENQAAAMDPTKSIGLSAAAMSLRIAVESLSTELSNRRLELLAASDAERYAEAAHYASSVRQLLVYHAAMADTSDKRIELCLGNRDAIMAANLEYIVSRERRRGKVLAFAHNSHLKLGRAEWQWGPNLLTWWPAGSHLHAMFGSRYAAVGVSVGESDAIGLAQPEAGTLEGLLSGKPGTARFVPTHLGEGLPAPAVAAIPTRSPSTNTAYFPFSSQSMTDFNWLAVLG